MNAKVNPEPTTLCIFIAYKTSIIKYAINIFFNTIILPLKHIKCFNFAVMEPQNRKTWADFYEVLQPGYAAVAQNANTAPGNMDALFAKMISKQAQDAQENQQSGLPDYCFIFEQDPNCPYIPWGAQDNEPFLYKKELMYSGQAGAIVQRLAAMLTKQGVWHEVELPQGAAEKMTEAERQQIAQTLHRAKAAYAKLGLYNAGVGKDEEGNYTDVHRANAVVEMVNNLILFNLAPIFISSRRIAAADNDAAPADRNFWQYSGVLSIPGENFRYGRQEYSYTPTEGVRKAMPYLYVLPKPSFTQKDLQPGYATALQAMGNRKKYADSIIKTPAFNPNKFVLDAQGNKQPLAGVNLIECWALRMDGVFDTGTYPIPIHSLGSFRNYRNLDFQLSMLLHNAIVRGQHIRGIVRVYDIAYNSLDAYIDAGTDIMQSLKNRWEKDKKQVLNIFTGMGSAGGIVVLPGMVPADAPQKHGTIEFTPVNSNFDTSLIEAAYATIKLELLSAFGIIDPRIVGVQLGKAGNLSDQAGLLEIAMEITKEFLEGYVTVINNFLTAFNEMAGIYHQTASGEKWKVRSCISIDTPYLKLFSTEMIEMLKLSAAHPNEVRTLLGMDNKPDEELSSNLTLQWKNRNTSANREDKNMSSG